MTTTSSKARDETAAVGVTVETKTNSFEFPVDTGERLLFAGLAQGITLPYECATGTCGTCRGRVMEGRVQSTWAAAPGMARFRPDKGDVLLCQARATEKCLIRVPSSTVERSATSANPARRTGVVTTLRKLTHDVLHVDIAMAEPVGFDGGQFVVVEAPGIEGGRAYSMVNYGHAEETLSFVVKRKPGGGFSDWLFEKATTGDTVELFGPLGRATFRPDEGRDLICIAGGSGIAGMMSILAHAQRSGFFDRNTAHVFFGVRRMTDGFYLAELSDLMKHADQRLAVTLALSDEPAATAFHTEHTAIKLDSGFVHDVARQALPANASAATAYLAGPAPLVDGAIRMLVTEANLPAQFIRYDKFS